MRRFHIVRIDSIGHSATVCHAAFPRDAVRLAFPECGEIRATATPASPELCAHGGVGAVSVFAGHDDCRYIVEEVSPLPPV